MVSNTHDDAFDFGKMTTNLYRGSEGRGRSLGDNEYIQQRQFLQDLFRSRNKTSTYHRVLPLRIVGRFL
jgi:hypothetical protein